MVVSHLTPISLIESIIEAQEWSKVFERVNKKRKDDEKHKEKTKKVKKTLKF